jgi:hypothetical protein
MTQKKKLQVFISSTADLREERQAAVEAILIAGHIPAGMELIAARDELQMNVIERWIDESDVYLLILGGRYGSIEPKSQKSYIQLEYEYALEQGKPLFALVITENLLDSRARKFGATVYERENPREMKEFRDLVMSNIVRFWDDPRDITVYILETMFAFSISQKNATLRAQAKNFIPTEELSPIELINKLRSFKSKIYTHPLNTDIMSLRPVEEVLLKTLEELRDEPVMVTGTSDRPVPLPWERNQGRFTTLGPIFSLGMVLVTFLELILLIFWHVKQAVFSRLGNAWNTILFGRRNGT